MIRRRTIAAIILPILLAAFALHRATGRWVVNGYGQPILAFETGTPNAGGYAPVTGLVSPYVGDRSGAGAIVIAALATAVVPLLLVSGAIALAARLAAGRRRAAGCCLTCGHDVTGPDAPRCGECGTPVMAA